MADAKVRHGMHRAQRRGRENVLIQALLTAAAMNLRKLARHQSHLGVGAAALAIAAISTSRARLRGPLLPPQRTTSVVWPSLRLRTPPALIASGC